MIISNIIWIIYIFYRRDTKIRDYFISNEYNKTIKKLSKEGYSAMFLKFKTLTKIYSNIYPINTEESLFIFHWMNILSIIYIKIKKEI